MPREGELEVRREDANPRVAAALGREHEHRLAEPDLERERLHRLVVEPARVGEDRELVPGERRIREHVGDDVAQARHDAPPARAQSAGTSDPPSSLILAPNRTKVGVGTTLPAMSASPCRKPVARASRLGGTNENSSVR